MRIWKLTAAIICSSVMSSGAVAQTITEIIDSTGDGSGNGLNVSEGVALDSAGNVFVAGRNSVNVFKIATPGSCSTSGTPCTISLILDSTGDGAGNTLSGSFGVAGDAAGNAYVAGPSSNNVFRIGVPAVPSVATVGLVLLAVLMTAITLWMVRRSPRPTRSS